MAGEHAIDDRDAQLTHVALHWDDELNMWRLLSLGRSKDEIEKRVEFWIGKGTRKCDIQVFELCRCVGLVAISEMETEGAA